MEDLGMSILMNLILGSMAKIVLIHSEIDSDIFPLLSLTIGLHKTYPKSEIVWVGEPRVLNLVKYNKRINGCLDINQEMDFQILGIIFGADICVNLSLSNKSRTFASQVSATKCHGFDKNGATSKQAEFFQKVISEKITTNKTILQMTYDVAGLNWRGEGYGLNYYPSTKQIHGKGQCFTHHRSRIVGYSYFKKNKNPLDHLNSINKYSEIMTDDLFTAHASIALRKHCTFVRSLPYQIEFFGKGELKEMS